MGNRLYDKGRELFLLGDLEWDTDVFSLLLIDTDDHAINHTNVARADITSGAEVANLAGNSTYPAALASKTHAAGLADAADATFEAVNGDEVEQLIIYKNSGATANDYLIVSIDTATGLALTPNTGDVTVVWNSNGIFRL
jgi:hypothetical protein